MNVNCEHKSIVSKLFITSDTVSVVAINLFVLSILLKQNDILSFVKVLNISSVTDRIKTGQKIEINGDEGTIIVRGVGK